MNIFGLCLVELRELIDRGSKIPSHFQVSPCRMYEVYSKSKTPLQARVKSLHAHNLQYAIHLKTKCSFYNLNIFWSRQNETLT